MDPSFRSHIDSLEPSFQRLMAMGPFDYHSLPRDIPKRGIYLFSENDTHFYVGRTNNLRRRLGNHCLASANHLTAAFAFRIAREESGMTRAS